MAAPAIDVFALRAAAMSLGLLLVTACAASPAPRARAARPRRARHARLEAGDRLDIERRVEERVDGELRSVRLERVHVAIAERRSDGTYDAAALLVATQGRERIGRIQYRIRLSPDLTLLGDPIEECEDLPDELEPERVLRHVLGAVPRPPRRGGDAYEGELWSELREQPLMAEVEVERDGDRMRARARSEITLEDDTIGGAVVSGRARVRVLSRTDRTLIAGEVRTRIEARATIRDPDDPRESARPGRIRIDEELTATRARGELPAEDVCRRSGELDVRAVVRMIQRRRGAIRACYERALRGHHELAGVVRISMTIQPSGEVTGARVTENALDVPDVTHVGACVIRVIETFHFDPGPEDGSVTYAFPFVFEPQN